MADHTRLVFISDTHGFHDIEVPAGDVLIHSGDGCSRGTLDETRRWGEFLHAQPHRHKLVIAGNHDRCFENDLDGARQMLLLTSRTTPDSPATSRTTPDSPASLTFLHDSGCEVDGIPVWGAPWQPWFLSWAFNLPRGPELARKWALIPDATDILITHGPPHGILDRTISGEAVGCEELRRAIARVRPRVHAFGHIHEGYGTAFVDGTMFVNASTCTLAYRPTNPAIVIDLPHDRSRPAELVRD